MISRISGYVDCAPCSASWSRKRGDFFRRGFGDGSSSCLSGMSNSHTSPTAAARLDRPALVRGRGGVAVGRGRTRLAKLVAIGVDSGEASSCDEGGVGRREIGFLFTDDDDDGADE